MTQRKEHPQAQWLRAIADGEALEFQDVGGHWRDFNDFALLLLSKFPLILRIKPRTITIGRYEVAASMREVPKIGARYFYIDFTETDGISGVNWDADNIDFFMLKSGICWLKREDAMLAAKAIRELLTGVKNDE